MGLDESLKLLVIAHEEGRHELTCPPSVNVCRGHRRSGAEVLGDLLEIFTPPTYKNMQAAFYLRSRNLPKTVGVSGPSSAAKAGVAVSPASLPTPSGDLSLIFLHPHTKTFYKLQVSRMALPTAPRFFLPCTPHLTLTPLTLT